MATPSDMSVDQRPTHYAFQAPFRQHHLASVAPQSLKCAGRGIRLRSARRLAPLRASNLLKVRASNVLFPQSVPPKLNKTLSSFQTAIGYDLARACGGICLEVGQA